MSKPNLNRAPPGRGEPKGRYEKSATIFELEVGAALSQFTRDLNVAELLLGKDSKIKRLPSKVHRLVREVLDEFFEIAGFYAQTSETGFSLCFPNLDREMADLKFSAISSEIERRAKSVGSENAPAGNAAVPPSRRKRETQEDRLITQAMAKMARARENWSDEVDIERLPDGIEARYLPMWLVKNKLLTSYVVRPVHAAENGKPELDHHSVEPIGDALKAAQLDLPLFVRAVRDLSQLVARKEHAVVIIPVHFATLDRRPYRDMYQKSFWDLDEALRRLIVVELVDLPETLPQFRLVDRMQQLRGLCRSVLVRADPRAPALKRFSNLKVHAVGVELGHYTGAESDMMDSLERFAHEAGRYRLRTYAQGVRTTSLTTAVVASGFDYIAGDSVSPLTDSPGGVKEFETSMLFG